MSEIVTNFLHTLIPNAAAPTATLGHAVPVGRWMEISRAEATMAKWFSSGAAVLQVSQYTN